MHGQMDTGISGSETRRANHPFRIWYVTANPLAMILLRCVSTIFDVRTGVPA
jgi:hypothetical protein